MNNRITMLSSLALGAVLALGLTAAAQATTFSFAGFTFEQDDTPDVFSLLGGGATIGGATFSAGNATSRTGSVSFPTTTTGFDVTKSLGRQAAAQAGFSACSGACAVNLPNGNNGTATRHGLQVSWSGSVGLTNDAGDDFVVYESASSSTGDEGFMVRLGDSGGAFSSWRFQTFDSYESYTGGSDGAIATAFDISDFGFGSSDLVTTIQIANLTATDTLGAGGSVLFGGGGAPHGFGSSSLDPDPLYVGTLSALGPIPAVPLPGGVVMMLGAVGALGAVRLGRRRRPEA